MRQAGEPVLVEALIAEPSVEASCFAVGLTARSLLTSLLLQSTVSVNKPLMDARHEESAFIGLASLALALWIFRADVFAGPDLPGDFRTS